MIGFLRKYQRLFFVIITVIIIATFTFFGTYSVTQQGDRREDHIIGKTVDGQPLKQSEIRLLSHFLSIEGISQGGVSNIFNDGVISQDFFRTGLAHILSKRYFEKIQPELQLSFEKSKKWSFYAHPQVPFLSSKDLWKRLQPEGLKKIDTLAKIDQLSIAQLDDYLDLQLFSHSLPSDYLKQILLYQQSQLPWITPDQRLIHEDLALFGFHQISDWMGDDFLDLVSQFIINCACVAKSKGYEVSWDEAKRDLYRIAYHHLEKMRSDLSSNTTKKDLINMHLRYLGMDEKRATAIWQKVLLFRKLMTDVAQNVFVDSLSIGDFASFVDQKALIDHYSLEKGLNFENFTQLMQFQLYLKAIGPYLANDKQYLRSIPEIFFTIKDIEKRYPELVEKCYEISYKKIDLDTLGVRIGEKELWDWQLDADHWASLQKEFSFLSSLPFATRDDRFESLESLSSSVREKLDDFSRQMIVQTLHQQWICDELTAKAPKKVLLHLRSKGGKMPLPGIEDISHFASLLDLSPLVDQTSLSDEQRKIQENLTFYTENKKDFYSIEVLRKAPQKRLITFAEGLEDNTLLNLLDHFLDPYYASLRNEQGANFKDAKGNWLSLIEAREKIGKILFSDLISALGQDGASLDMVAKNRFVSYLLSQKEALKSQREINLLVDDKSCKLEEDFFAERPQYAFHEQWMIRKTPLSIDRGYEDVSIREKAFALSDLAFSEAFISKEGAAFLFFKGFEKRNPENLSDQIDRSKGPLAYEAVCELGNRLLDEIEGKQAIVLPVYQEKQVSENE